LAFLPSLQYGAAPEFFKKRVSQEPEWASAFLIQGSATPNLAREKVAIFTRILSKRQAKGFA